MPRRKEKGRSAPRFDEQRFAPPPTDVFRSRLAAGADITGGSRELRRRIETAGGRRKAA
jgi:hypothetical protein